jgi:hypothetical protein
MDVSEFIDTYSDDLIYIALTPVALAMLVGHLGLGEGIDDPPRRILVADHDESP